MVSSEEIVVKKACLLAALLALATLNSCAPSGTKFDSEQWKSGSSSRRGAMAGDLIRRRLLPGQSRPEAQDLLGRPDFCGMRSYDDRAVTPLRCGDPREDWYAYEVVTVWPRPSDQRYFCSCRLELRFNRASKLVDSVEIRD